MAFSDTTLDSGHWCSRADCVDVLDDLERMIDANETKLNRCIVSATGEVASHLRGRWPNAWPFGSNPPQEIRAAVATVAVYRALRGRTFSGGSLEISDRVAEDASDAMSWVRAVGDSKAHLDFPTDEGEHRVYVAAAPRGEFGFVKR
jgi:phage gp36-like protein